MHPNMLSLIMGTPIIARLILRTPPYHKGCRMDPLSRSPLGTGKQSFAQLTHARKSVYRARYLYPPAREIQPPSNAVVQNEN